jgi:hypothetical protein
MNASDSVLPPPVAERPALRLLERPLHARTLAAAAARAPQHLPRPPSASAAWLQAWQRWVAVWRG